MRQLISQAVGEDAEMLDVSRGFDYVRALGDHWEAVHRGRERLIANFGAGYKPRPRRVSWLDAADRLARLRAGGAVRKGAVYC